MIEKFRVRKTLPKIQAEIRKKSLRTYPRTGENIPTTQMEREEKKLPNYYSDRKRIYLLL